MRQMLLPCPRTPTSCVSSVASGSSPTEAGPPTTRSSDSFSAAAVRRHSTSCRSVRRWSVQWSDICATASIGTHGSDGRDCEVRCVTYRQTFASLPPPEALDLPSVRLAERMSKEGKWSRWESNPRPLECHAGSRCSRRALRCASERKTRPFALLSATVAHGRVPSNPHRTRQVGASAQPSPAPRSCHSLGQTS